MNSTGLPTPKPSPMSLPTRPVKTIGGSRSSTPKPLGRGFHTHRTPRPVRMSPAPSTACKSPSALVARRQNHRLHRRPDERPGRPPAATSGSSPAQQAASRATSRQAGPASPHWIAWGGTSTSSSAKSQPAATLSSSACPSGRSRRRPALTFALHLQPSRYRRRRQHSITASPPPPTAPSSSFRPAPSPAPEIYAAGPAAAALAPASSTSAFGLTQLSHINDGLEPAWGKSVSLDLDRRQFPRSGLAPAARRLRSEQKVPAYC